MKLHDRDEDRPRLPTCDNCGCRYLPWEARDCDWNLLPPEYRPLCLCIGCFVRTLAAAGHSPDKVRISFNTWRRLQQIWLIRLGRIVHIDLGKNIRWARVTFIISVRKVRVRLLGHGPDAGELVAEWDGERRHRRIGRPVLRAAGWRSNVASVSR